MKVGGKGGGKGPAKVRPRERMAMSDWQRRRL